MAGSGLDATIAPGPHSNGEAKLSMEKGLSTLELTAFSGAIPSWPMSLSDFVVLTAIVGSLPVIGCVQDVRFNPTGCEVHVRGRWLVDGQDPTPENCENIALVELAIINDLETQFYAPPEFTLKCDAENDANAALIDGGAYLDTILVTRNRCGGTGEILERPLTDEYKSRWRATTERNFIVDCSPIQTTPITEVDGGAQLVLDVGTVDFQTADGGVVCPPP